MEHALNDDCPCGTTDTPVEQEDGSIDWVITHRQFEEPDILVRPQ